jgi:thymidylate synthase (FAD)
MALHTATLVWITPDAERLIAKIARVSNPSGEDSPNFEGLLRYLIRNAHWSPFEMASMCVEIRTTRAIAAQILRHRSFSFQEFSQRYSAVVEPAVVFDLRRQDTKNRQNSIDDLSDIVKSSFSDEIEAHFRSGENIYSRMIEAGVAKECARGVLSLSSPTRLYMTGTIRSWLHYVALRGESHGAQREHSLVAEAVLRILKEYLPTVTGSFLASQV